MLRESQVASANRSELLGTIATAVESLP